MDRSVMVASVFHTGSRFFLDLIGEAVGADYFHILPRHTSVTWHPLVLCHIEPKRMKHLRYYIDHYDPVIVVPMRDMEATKNSWENRRTKYTFSLTECVALRDAVIAEYDPVIVSIDAWNKDVLLENLSDALHVTIQTDWVPKSKHTV